MFPRSHVFLGLLAIRITAEGLHFAPDCLPNNHISSFNIFSLAIIFRKAKTILLGTYTLS